MAGRSRAYSTSSRADEVEYFLIIQGLSPQCRWQELKDVIRKIPPDGYIRQAHTDNDNGTGWGNITILNKRKAFDAYDYLYSNGWRGHSIRLTLVVRDETSSGGLQKLRGPEDGLLYVSQRLLPLGPLYSSQSSVIPSSNVPSVSHILGSSPVPPVYQSAAPMAMQPPLLLQHPFPHVYNSYPPPSMIGSHRLIQKSSPLSHGTAKHRHKASGNRPVSKSSTPTSNMRGSHASGPTDNEGRTVYLYNLPYTVSQQGIKDYLAPAGVVDRCLVKEDRHRSSKYKLTAVATFRTPQQAQTAIDRFNRSSWKGYEIKVKLDRGPTASCASVVRSGKASITSRAMEEREEISEGPLVVNGSGPSISSRQTCFDSDDESSCDEEN